ncbi:MAG: hypothetical protein AUJ49_06270 [Desulfovibrionaceae bacterium CG1_02_65_16]|nr:MAG: hypothetical protein AUJ49_06270 [Desulfovibrionaceae bacterium CG1_02_65_16]
MEKRFSRANAMKRLCSLLLIAAIAAAPLFPAVAGRALCAETAPAPTANPMEKPAAKGKPAKQRRTAAKTRAAKARAAKARAAVKAATSGGQANGGASTLTREELASPYSAEQGPKRTQPGWAAQNATQWFFDTSPTAKPLGAQPKKAEKQDDSGISLYIGQDRKVDPLTGEEVKHRFDPARATDDLKNLDLKGALDKVGGKAEVQVDILKF